MYSRRHQYLNPNGWYDSEQFFDFSFYEMGEYDTPAQIDFVRLKTGVDKVSYIGHSQGTTSMFSALAENSRNFADKINLFIALAPVAVPDISNEPFLYGLSQTADIMKDALDNLNLYEIYGPTWDATTKMFCLFFGDICDGNALWRYEVTDYVNDY